MIDCMRPDYFDSVDIEVADDDDLETIRLKLLAQSARELAAVVTRCGGTEADFARGYRRVRQLIDDVVGAGMCKVAGRLH